MVLQTSLDLSQQTAQTRLHIAPLTYVRPHTYINKPTLYLHHYKALAVYRKNMAWCHNEHEAVPVYGGAD